MLCFFCLGSEVGKQQWPGPYIGYHSFSCAVHVHVVHGVHVHVVHSVHVHVGSM